MVYFFESLGDQVDAFNCLFLDVFNDYAPITLIKIKSRPNRFITQEIKQPMKTRDFWHKRAKKTQDRLHWNVYRFLRQEMKPEITLVAKMLQPVAKMLRHSHEKTTCLASNRC